MARKSVYGFEESSARRIAGAVRAYERMPQPSNLLPQPGIVRIDDLVDVLISGFSKDGSNWRWSYFAQVAKRVKSAAAWEGWEPIIGAESVTAYNRVELNNGASGTVSGITLDSEVTGIEPAPAGVYLARRILVSSDPSVVEYWFHWQNVPVIECEE